jgi:hypothetical protein
MAGKNKGGREIRKPKQEKKPKADKNASVIPMAASPKVRSAK